MNVGVATEFAIVVRQLDSVVVLELLGEHDMSTAHDLKRVISEASLSYGIVVSVVDTDFIDSSILSVLLQSDRLMVAKGRRLVIHTNATAIANAVLEVAGVTEQLLCCDTLDEAVEFASQASE